MKFGVVFPQTEIETDAIAVRDFVQAVESLGFDYLLTYELVTDTKSENPPASWREPFTLLSYVAAVTTQLELATGIVVLPSRQTVLVAKQAAELDLLSNGRLRLGVAAGWNRVEYHAMGVDFEARGARLEEQISVMRDLWTKPYVSVAGKYHQFQDIGIYPRPVQQPIPVWIGGHQDTVVKRVAQYGDGWMAHGWTPESIHEKRDLMNKYAGEAGRKQATIGLNIVGVEILKMKAYAEMVESWQKVGATHLDVSTKDEGLHGVQAHIEAIRRFKDGIG